jgi:hypothetical protein
MRTGINFISHQLYFITGPGGSGRGNNDIAFNKLLSLNVDNIDSATVGNRIITNGAILSGVFCWGFNYSRLLGVAGNLNYGGSIITGFNDNLLFFQVQQVKFYIQF